MKSTNGSADVSSLIRNTRLRDEVSVSGLSFFHTEGRDLVSDQTGEKTVFRGVNLNGLEFGSFFNNPYPGVEGTHYFKPRPQDMANLDAVGVNVIRVPFEWARLVSAWTPPMPLPAVLNPSYLGMLDEVVQSAGERQIYVILDMHDFLKYWSGQSTQACVENSPSHQQLLAQTWKLLAAHFSNNRAVLGYDIQNEPVRMEGGEPCGSCSWHAISQSVVDSIRTVDQNHLIFIEGPNFSLASNWPIENGQTPFILDRIAPSRIVYSPHVFFDLNNDSIYGESERPGPLGRWQYYMRDRLMPVIDWSIANNVAVFFGEVNVPCSVNWSTVLEAAFRDFYDPLHLSVTLWHYINPAVCPLDLPGCSLNLAACAQQYQLNVLEQHLGGTYQRTESYSPTPTDSRLYDDVRVNPWDAGAGFFDDGANPGININFSATTQVFEGSRSISVDFIRNNFAGVKFIHQYGLDASRFRTLTFRILLAGNGQQNVKIFTTNPRSDCERIQNPSGLDPVYPPTFDQQPELRDYLPSASVGQWMRVDIPLTDIVNPNSPIINGVTLQNMGLSQETLHLDDIRLRPADPVGTIGLYNHSQSAFFLRNSNSSAPADLVFGYGPANAGWMPVVGDWNGDGVDTIGLFNPTTSTFFLRNSNSTAPADLTFGYGPPGAGWIPIAGDWNGDGIDTIGLYQPSTSIFFLRNSNSTGVADLAFSYGPAGAGWKPIVGDWNGDGIDTIGLYNPATSAFFLRNANSSAPADLVFFYGPAGAGWIPLAGDWNGDGTDTIGLYNPATSFFFLRNANSTAPADLTFSYGPAGAGWNPLVGDWNGL